MADVSILFQQALEHHRAGRLPQAEVAYRSVLQAQPEHAPSLHLLGTIALASGQPAEAIDNLRASAKLDPNQPLLHAAMAEAYAMLGQADEAIASYRRALAWQPSLASAHLALGVLLHKQGAFAEAEECYRQTLRLDPRQPAAQHNLGTLRQQAGDLESAADHFRQALEIDPNHAGALVGLGQIVSGAGNLEEAHRLFERAARAQPDLIQPHVNLAAICEALGRVTESIEHYQHLARLVPDSAEVHFNLGAALREAGQPLEALAEFDRALQIDSDLVPAHIAVADVCNAMSRPDLSVAACRRALELDPQSAAAYGHLGVALLSQADIAGALDAYRRNLELNPDSAQNHSNYIYALNLPFGGDPQQVFAEHRAWAARHADPLTARAPAHDNDPDPDRPLRVGYVCGHFRTHAISTFSEPLITSHDPRAVEVCCYYDDLKCDEVTERFRAAARQWRVIYRLAPDVVAQMIRDDRIDILVDLVGHVGGNQLLVFAHKPAPVQVTYLGYQNTTGMQSMDYRLTDAQADPPGMTEAFHTEQLVRLPRAFFCYRPPHPAPEVGPLPALAAGQVTFGSFNHQQKLTPELMQAWAQILAAVPASRLMVLAYAKGLFEERLQSILAKVGVAANRLLVQDKRPRYEYLKLFQQVDIALDSFPFNGHTTVCDAVWMGVPSVMLEGCTYASRFGGSVHRNVGLGDWIARDVEEYVEVAVSKSQDLLKLRRLRSELRTRMVTSPLRDAAGFARHVEAAYRQMWRSWCAQHRPTPRPGT